MVGINQDNTQQRRYEQVLADANAELEQRVAARTEELATALAELKEAARLKDEFMATVSHELRTPLMGILSMADVLDEQLRPTLNQRQLRYIHNVRSSGQRLLQIVNSILNYTALASGRAVITPECCHLGELGAIVVQAIRTRVEAKNLTLTLSVKPADLTVTTDSAGLKQILQHLLDNAVKFTPGGGQIGLEIERVPAAQCVQLVVWDTGIGISPKQQENIFQPFVQADASLARQYEGLGLGLAYVQRMVDLLDGTIAVESTPGAGSRFTVSLPAG
ncbi:MAG: HAMP domain-containing histidine kinase [Anaerolineales bacterium]|nr:HAMP domain-containing histidine kinase [Anaerolineales bacterium]